MTAPNATTPRAPTNGSGMCEVLAAPVTAFVRDRVSCARAKSATANSTGLKQPHKERRT
jgi:hypothetical protein